MEEILANSTVIETRKSACKWSVRREYQMDTAQKIIESNSGLRKNNQSHKITLILSTLNTVTLLILITNMAPHGKSSTAASAKGKATPAKAKNNNNKKKKKTKESTTPTKDNLLSPEQFNKFYDELIRLAELIPQNQQHADHVSIATILKDNKMKAVCWYILTVSSFGSNDGRRNNITLKKIIKLFKSAGCDIRPFRGGKDKDEQEKNLTAYYEKHENNISYFLTAMFVYTIRCKQGACAVCGKVIEDLLFGALGYESNHWEDDKDSNDCGGEGDKCFGVSCTNFGLAFVRVMNLYQII